MTDKLNEMTSGLQGLELGYTVVLLAILVGLYHARASWNAYLLSPLVAGVMTVFSAIVVAITSPLLRLFGIGDRNILQLLYGFSVVVAMSYVAGRVLAARQGGAGPEHRRGAWVNLARPDSTQQAGRAPGRRSGANSAGITVAGVPIPLEDETKHFKIIGTTGTGKSTAIREILTGALARGDRAIIADPDGGYARRFYNPARGDVILNPFDRAGRKWDLFGEIVNNYDIDQLARSLIPDSGGPDRIWSEYGRTFFGAVVRQALRVPNTDDRELFRLLTAAPQSELRTMLIGTAAAPFLEEGNEKMFGSIRSVVASAVEALEYVIDQESELFSVRKWVREGKSKHAGGSGGVLFIPYTAGEIAALRSMISAWMRLGIFEAMDREEGDQRLWFVIDELDALGEIDGLKDALARLRKFGGRCILGLQSISQVSGTYGKGTAETIVENCGNTYILRCSASEHGGTSEFASKLIGQREVVHTTTSKTRRSRWDWRSSVTTSQQIRTESAVMASEIERLPDLTGFLKLASIPDWHVAILTPPAESAIPSAWNPTRTSRTPRSPTTPPAPATSSPSAVSSSTPEACTPSAASASTPASAPSATPSPTTAASPTMPGASTPRIASSSMPAAPTPMSAPASSPATPPLPTLPTVAPATPITATARAKPRSKKGAASSTPKRPRQPRAVPQPDPQSDPTATPVQIPPKGAQSDHQPP